MSIHKNGFWLNTSMDGHIYDSSLNNALISFFKKEGVNSVVDLGCGTGSYAIKFKQEGLSCDCYDGNPNTKELSNYVCEVLDLAQDSSLNKTYDCVLSLEVGEHIPKEFESVFLTNLAKHSNKLLILSWAVVGQGGRGHVNERNNDYIEQQISKLGFKRNFDKEKVLRDQSTLRWFKNTIMVYEKENIKA